MATADDKARAMAEVECWHDCANLTCRNEVMHMVTNPLACDLEPYCDQCKEERDNG